MPPLPLECYRLSAKPSSDGPTNVPFLGVRTHVHKDPGGVHITHSIGGRKTARIGLCDTEVAPAPAFENPSHRHTSTDTAHHATYEELNESYSFMDLPQARDETEARGTQNSTNSPDLFGQSSSSAYWQMEL